MKRYVITDPCYIIADSDWRELCQLVLPHGQVEFIDAISDILTRMSGSPALACDTGIGDWTNELVGPGVINSRFAADAGMVCVCELSEPIRQALATYSRRTLDHIAAVVDVDDDISIQFDKSMPGWTVVMIHTSAGLIRSRTAAEFEEFL